jgi:prepilin-type N-terminal cleavage/methylation domain-containing protein/prepilin-type processing-associated H-X9-DG protein
MSRQRLLQPSRVAPRGRRAFTLVELLVVIGIIAVLLSVLLPVLGSARRRAQSVACASNMRQIYMAMAMFAHDNKGQLPRPYGVNDLSSNADMRKTFAWLQLMSGKTAHIDMRDDMGALWKYLKGKETREKVLACPGDEMEPIAGHPYDSAYPRNVSYSLNRGIERPGSGSNNKVLGIPLSKVKESASKIMIYEELAPNDAWCIMGPPGTPGTSSDDVPSGRHGGGMRSEFRNRPTAPEYKSKGRGNFCFFDGHVESLAPGTLLSQQGKTYHRPLWQGDDWR